MSKKMKPKEFRLLLDRDGYCLHCGETEAISPNHRKNRGMGGSKLGNKPSNLIVLCSSMNSLIESDARWAELAKSYGWKLESWQDPIQVPVYDAIKAEWFRLTDDYAIRLKSPLDGAQSHRGQD
jgi:hypothetical protein